MKPFNPVSWPPPDKDWSSFQGHENKASFVSLPTQEDWKKMSKLWAVVKALLWAKITVFFMPYISMEIEEKHHD